MTIQLNAIFAEKIGFASQQNAVPILHQLSVHNQNDIPLNNLCLTLSSSPNFITTKTWKIDQLAASEERVIFDTKIDLNSDYLFNLTESINGTVSLRLTQDDEVLSEQKFELELLAKNHWGGDAMLELLAAFVTPNDPAIDKILKAASDVLRQSGKKDALNGYSDQSRSRTWEMVSALWSAVADLKLSYALPPASFEQQGQKIRTPSSIWEGRLATCLDSTILFASALEQMRLNPLLILLKGHAFVGVWLQPQEFSSLVTDDPSAVRKAIDLQEMIVFETTMITHSPVPKFSLAVANANSQLQNDEVFEFVLDIKRARMQQIKALSLTNIAPTASSGEDVLVTAGFEEAPDLPAFDVEDDRENNSDNVSDQLNIWQKKLLNLTTRNRLLHFGDKAKGIRLICPDPARLEDLLAQGKGVKFTSLPEIENSGRSEDLFSQQTHQDWALEYATAAFNKGEVVSRLDKNRLDALLTDLYLTAKHDLEEGGANTLYLAVGFLKWKKSAQEKQDYRAPLILLPIKFERRSLTHITMKLTDEEPRFNLTLLELLRQDFGLTIPALEQELPHDESGIHVEQIWKTVQYAVKDIPGFEVVNDVAVGIFSFAKYFMWKDMVDQREKLLKNPLVKHLIERKQQNSEYDSGEQFIQPNNLDQNVPAQDLFLPLPADSSQIASIVASTTGKNFVLDGPPGTGKSQTIANMIAHNLAKGRRILFVAEKKAALDVVYRRLEEKGLGEFCIELHSNKTNKKEFLNQLDRAWSCRENLSPEEWKQEATRLQHLREKLNALVFVLHKPWKNGFTIHQAMGKVIRDADSFTPTFQWQKGTLHNEEEMTAMRDIVRRLGLNSPAARKYHQDFQGIFKTEWTNGWQSAVVSNAENFVAQYAQVKQGVLQLQQTLSVQFVAENFSQWANLAQKVLACYGVDCGFIFSINAATTMQKSTEMLAVLSDIKDLREQLSLPYSLDYIASLNVKELTQQWQTAEKKFWFLATMAKNKIATQLASNASLAQKADVSTDLPLFTALQTKFEEISKLSRHFDNMSDWKGINTDVDKFSEIFSIGNELRQAMNGLAQTPEELSLLRAGLARYVVEANELLAPEGVFSQTANRLIAQVQQYEQVEQQFEQLLDNEYKTDLLPIADAISRNAFALKSWCDWCRVKQEAERLGLAPLIECLQQAELDETQAVDLFNTGYARWFATWAIDDEPLLTHFVPAEHQSDIDAYRSQDDKLSSLAVKYIRAKLSGNLPDKNDVSKRSDFGILKHELQKQRAHKAIRQLSSEISQAMPLLAPCMLMSPLSVAQYLPLEQQPFDLVIFDEASQITPWDAIGVMARGKQVIIAGDDKQMPPTNFFNRGDSSSDDDTEQDMESILSECLAAGVPQYRLNWHYRSRHESLITFSNRTYYDNSLITFPSSKTQASAVHWRKVDGVYAKGKRINQAEAEAMVAEVVKRLRDPKFIAEKNSIGIITLNSDQQKLVSDLLDQARQKYPEIEPHFAEDCIEPVIVKNLESIQGDERDVILLGIGFAPTELNSKVMSMNFGPLNRQGGHRRLNVAVTRSRKEMLVFTSFDPYMIDLNRTNAQAVRDLKLFIEFAQKGVQVFGEAHRGSVGDYDSPFEVAVAEGLRHKGWDVVPQIGVSRFRIDLGIIHPDRPGDYLVGVECDGATYHSAATARDRDKVRASILQSLGWRLLRVWSTNWWIDKETALNELDQKIQELLEESRQAQVLEPAEMGEHIDEVMTSELQLDGENESSEIANLKLQATTTIEPKLNHHSVYYNVADLDEFNVIQEAFNDDSYTSTLIAMIQKVVDIEAPICEDLLVERIRKAHNFAKAGRLIRERIRYILSHHFWLRKGVFGEMVVWKDSKQASQFNQFRLPESEESKRDIDKIPLVELQLAMKAATESDKALEVAHWFGFKRVTSKMRERLES